MSWVQLLLLMHAGESTTGMGATSWSLLLLLLHNGVSTIGMGTKYWVLLSLLLHIGVSTIGTNADGEGECCTESTVFNFLFTE